MPFTIIGVADPRFDSLSPGRVYDVWVPLSVLPQINPRPWVKARATDAYSWWLVVIGRLKPGVGRLQAQAAVTTVFRNDMLHGAKPLSKPEDDPKVDVLPAQSGLTGSTTEISGELYVLMMAVGIVLLIACANVAGLLLARATARQKEIAVRLSLGAGRRRIVEQLLTESVLLSLMGGALGILFAIWGTRTIVALFTSSSDEPFGFSPGIDGRVLLFTFAAAMLTGIIFGLAPAFRGTRVDLTPALKEGTKGSAAEGRAGGRWFSLGNGLVIAQVALAVVVLVGAGLLVRTLQNLRNVDPGFDTRNLLTFGLDPTLIGYKTPQIDAFYGDLQQRIAAIPGVESVSYSNSTLLSGSLWETGFHLENTPKDQESNADYLPIGAGFFSMMHMQLLSGRNFNSADFAQAEAAAERERARADVEKAKDAGLPAPSGSAAIGERGKGSARAGDREQDVRAEIFSESQSARSSFWSARGRPGKRGLGSSGLGDFRGGERREVSRPAEPDRPYDVRSLQRRQHEFRSAYQNESHRSHRFHTQRGESDGQQFAGVRCAHAGGTDRPVAVSRAHDCEAVRIFRHPGAGAGVHRIVRAAFV